MKVGMLGDAVRVLQWDEFHLVNEMGLESASFNPPQAPIRLTVDPTAGKPSEVPKSGLSLAPPLELVISTKYPGC